MSAVSRKKREVLTDPQIRVVNTLRHGVAWANEMQHCIKETDVANWDDRKRVVAALVWAAAMASTTELDEESWLDLATMAFRGVSVDPL
jgi:hypothetical protein